MHLKNNLLRLVMAACLVIGIWLFTRARLTPAAGTCRQFLSWGGSPLCPPRHGTGVLGGAGPVEITTVPVSARALKMASHSCLLLRRQPSAGSLHSTFWS